MQRRSLKRGSDWRSRELWQAVGARANAEAGLETLWIDGPP
jgi:hypothetical protein